MGAAAEDDDLFVELVLMRVLVFLRVGVFLFGGLRLLGRRGGRHEQ